MQQIQWYLSSCDEKILKFKQTNTVRQRSEPKILCKLGAEMATNYISYPTVNFEFDFV